MKKICLLLLVFVLFACTDNSTEYASSCGTVENQELKNTISEIYGRHVKVVGIASPVLISVVDDENRAFLIQLHAVEVNPAKSAAAINLIKSLGSSAYMFIADEECTVESGDVEALPGQLYSDDERNFTEELLKAKLVNVNDSPDCSGEPLVSCYDALLLQK